MGEAHRAGRHQTADHAEKSSAHEVAITRHDTNVVQGTCPNEFGRWWRSYRSVIHGLALIHSDLSRNGEVTRCVKKGPVVSPRSPASSFASGVYRLEIPAAPRRCRAGSVLAGSASGSTEISYLGEAYDANHPSGLASTHRVGLDRPRRGRRRAG